MQTDADFIIEYIQNEFKPKQIGVHGTSLGGLVSTYLANSKKLDFLCADRTFGSIAEVAKYSFGYVAKFLFMFLVDWNVDLSINYFSSSSYKVLIYDPRDEIITLLSSLFFGTLKQMIFKRNNFVINRMSSSFEKYPKFKWIKSIFCVIMPFIKKYQDFQHSIKEDKVFNAYFNNNFFSDHLMQNLAKIMKRVLIIVIEILKNKKIKNNVTKKLDFLQSFEKNNEFDLTTTLNSSGNELCNTKKESFDINISELNLEEDIGNDYINLMEENDKNNEDFQDFVYKVFIYYYA